jgi:DNA-binding LacI/PurR family transcriptional regulator
MGREAVKALVARIAKPAAPGAVLNVPVEFIPRESLARHSPKA